MSFTREEILEDFEEASRLGYRSERLSFAAVLDDGFAPRFRISNPALRRERERLRIRAYRAANRERLNAVARLREAHRPAERTEYMRAYCKQWREKRKAA